VRTLSVLTALLSILLLAAFGVVLGPQVGRTPAASVPPTYVATNAVCPAGTTTLTLSGESLVVGT
jgi:hypothetical protein